MIADVSTLEEAAEYLRVTQRKLKSLALGHRIGYVKQGNAYTFPRAALEQYIADNTSAVIAPNAFGLTDRSAARLTKTTG